ncbi:hypothetical protein [uncultured Thiohalocapsa sp.]|uniref:hypothetical protein n=1 Tax=uncultured Thiohalocapsa sp. TaxID=768990 RepID=UPI0025DA8334|nr:hypothetical protein [uncultured Thiohalocapsa sp.]
MVEIVDLGFDGDCFGAQDLGWPTEPNARGDLNVLIPVCVSDGVTFIEGISILLIRRIQMAVRETVFLERLFTVQLILPIRRYNLARFRVLYTLDSAVHAKTDREEGDVLPGGRIVLGVPENIRFVAFTIGGQRRHEVVT